jgi:hypothetical protein
LLFIPYYRHPGYFIKAKRARDGLLSESIVVMTRTSKEYCNMVYGINPGKITVIPHGTHLVPQLESDLLKRKVQLTGRIVLTTFGLLSSGKSMETTLEALPAYCEVQSGSIVSDHRQNTSVGCQTGRRKIPKHAQSKG